MGAAKYQDRNWEKDPQYSRGYSALRRHLARSWNRQETNPETGMNHLAHVATNLSVLKVEMRPPS
jgi:hypothetical protein